jgi:hypothetical protein
MRGIRRERGAAQRQAKPLLREDLSVVLASMGVRIKDLRDTALLLIGFAGGLRRSGLPVTVPALYVAGDRDLVEFVAVTRNDLGWVLQGVIFAIRRRTGP